VPAGSTRDRPAKAPLSLEAIVAAGLRLLREAGIEGVTMRRVAAALDTGPASLYVYVANRQALLDEMFDAVAGQVPLGDDPDPARWREQLEALLTATRDAMDAHPGIARVPLGSIPTGPNATRIADRVIGLLRAGGVDDRSAAWAVDVVFLYINAASYETSIYVEEGKTHEELDEGIVERFSQLPRDEYPNVTGTLEHLIAGDGEQRFAFGLALRLNGLLHTAPPDTTP
jgi:AcrR family transcriptional regulator